MHSKIVLSTQNLCKKYGNFTALNEVNIQIPAGSVYGLLGPNGSGKTTFLGIVLDILKSTSGSYFWFDNMDANEARKQIGSLLETPNLYTYGTAWEHLKISAHIKDVSDNDIETVLVKVGLYERAHQQVITYSLGMKQRLALATALLGNPKILVLDEPTNGLDPQGIADMRQLILKLASEGITIIVSSHLLDEIERICTHVAILQRGKLIKQGEVKNLLSNPLPVFELEAQQPQELKNVLSQWAEIESCVLEGNKVLIKGRNLTAQSINQYCFNNSIVLMQIQTRNSSLEEAFIELTSQKK
jgi:ABC-2 type transport system ATP-binding protein